MAGDPRQDGALVVNLHTPYTLNARRVYDRLAGRPRTSARWYRAMAVRLNVAAAAWSLLGDTEREATHRALSRDASIRARHAMVSP